MDKVHETLEGSDGRRRQHAVSEVEAAVASAARDAEGLAPTASRRQERGRIQVP
jgi:hypothetical protein